MSYQPIQGIPEGEPIILEENPNPDKSSGFLSLAASPDSKAKALELDSAGNLKVAVVSTVAPGGTSNNVFFSGALGTTGLDSGLTSMVQNAVTPMEFMVTSSSTHDIYITGLSLVLIDGNVTYSKFGALSPLINGFTLSLYEGATQNYLLNAAKTSGDIVSQSWAPGFSGTGTTTTLISGIQGGVCQMIGFQLHDLIPGGFRIPKGSTNKVSAIIADNLSALTAFSIRAFGYMVEV